MDKETLKLLSQIGISTAGQILTLIVLIFSGKQLLQFFLSTTVEVKRAELSRDAELYRQTLVTSMEQYKLELSKVLETHKSELGMISAKNSKLHDVRLQIIAELYKKISIMEQAFREMTARIKFVQEDSDFEEKERIRVAGESFNDFKGYYSQNKIFFSPQTCDVLDKILDHTWVAHWDYTFKQRMGVNDVQINRDFFEKAAKTIENDLPLALGELHKSFRQLLLVE